MAEPRARHVLALALPMSCVAARAAAHDLVPPPSAAAWNWFLLAGLVVAALCFVRGQRVLRARGATSLAWWLRTLWFGLSLASLIGALLSPLDRFSEAWFSAHMLQHELLMLIAAPLLVLARPLSVYVWALPDRTRTRLMTWIQRPHVSHALHVLGAPALALLVHGLTRWLWHIPALFEACLQNEALHAVQHATFFCTALWFWWSIVQGGYGKAGYGVSALFVFATGLHSGALGLLINLAGAPWYPTHAARTAAVGGDALLDQQLAGLIMWIVAGVLFCALGLGLFSAWLGHARRAGARGSVAKLCGLA